MKSQAIKTAMDQNPVRRRVTTAKVEERHGKEEPKLPPGAKAVNTFWTKVIKRDTGEDSEETNLAPVPRRLKFPESFVDQPAPQSQVAPRSRPRSWGPPAVPKCPVCGKPV